MSLTVGLVGYGAVVRKRWLSVNENDVKEAKRDPVLLTSSNVNVEMEITRTECVRHFA